MYLSEDELKALMLQALDGDGGAYRRRLDAVKARLEGVLRPRLASDAAQAEDFVQETLIAIHAKRATFDRCQPFTAWTYAMARYKLVDHYRRSGRRRDVPLDDQPDLVAANETGAAEARQDLARVLAVLPRTHARPSRQRQASRGADGRGGAPHRHERWRGQGRGA